MKRPETPPENLVGIQGDSLQITNMRKKVEEQMKKEDQKKHTFIMVNGKQFPQRKYNPQMAKRRLNTCSDSISNSHYVDLDSSSNSQFSDSYVVYYEFPAFPSNALFKHRTMMPKSYFPRTVQERLPTRSEFQKLFSPKKTSKIELMLADTAPETPEKSIQSPKIITKKSSSKKISRSNLSMSYPQNRRLFQSII